MWHKLTWAALFLSAAAFAVEEEDVEDFVLEPREHNGVVYLSGGVGRDEREAMQAEKHRYNLWLSFDRKDDSGLDSDTEVSIVDGSGEVVLTTVTDGPWLMVRLPSGRYQIKASDEHYVGVGRVSIEDKGLARHVVPMRVKGESLTRTD